MTRDLIQKARPGAPISAEQYNLLVDQANKETTGAAQFNGGSGTFSRGRRNRVYRWEWAKLDADLEGGVESGPGTLFSVTASIWRQLTDNTAFFDTGIDEEKVYAPPDLASGETIEAGEFVRIAQFTDAPDNRWYVVQPAESDPLRWCKALSNWDATDPDNPVVSCRHSDRAGVIDDAGETPFDVQLPIKRVDGVTNAPLDPSVYTDDVISYQVDEDDDKICQSPYLWSFIGQIIEYGSVAQAGKIPKGWEDLTGGVGRVALQLDSGGETNERTIGGTGGFTLHGALENDHDDHDGFGTHTIADHGSHTILNHGSHSIDFHSAHTISNHGTHTIGDHGSHMIADHGAHTISDHGSHTILDHGAHTISDHGAHTILDHGSHTILDHGTHGIGGHDAHTISNHGAHTISDHGAHTIGDHDNHPDHDHHPSAETPVVDQVAGVTDGTATTGAASAGTPHTHDFTVASTEAWFSPDESSGATTIGLGTGSSGLFTHSVHTGTAITDTYVHAGTAITDTYIHASGAGQGLGHDAHGGTAITDAYVHAGTAITDLHIHAGTAITDEYIHAGTAITDTYIHAGTAITDTYIHAGTAITDLHVHAGTAITDLHVHAGTAITDTYAHSEGAGMGLEHGNHDGTAITDTYIHSSGAGQGLGHDAHGGTAITDQYVHSGTAITDLHIHGPGAGIGLGHTGVGTHSTTDNRQKFLVVKRIIRTS